MNRFALLILIMVLISCAEKPKPLIPYTIKIEREALSSNLNDFELETKVDTIFAIDDLSAYSDGINQYYSHLLAEKTSNYKIFRTRSYSIQDTNGLDLELKLPKNVVDSIKNATKKISDKIAQDLQD